MLLSGIPEKCRFTKKTAFRNESWTVLRKTRNQDEYIAGSYVGAYNVNDGTDLVVLPKIEGVDFVSMMDRALCSGRLTADRLSDIVHWFADGRPVRLEGNDEFMREYLVLLFAEVLFWARGTDDLGTALVACCGNALSEAGRYDVLERLRHLFPEDRWRFGGNSPADRQVVLRSDGKGGLKGAAARALKGLDMTLEGEVPYVMPFLVDMPLLFELQCLCMMLDAGRSDDLVFQGRFSLMGHDRYPDILKVSERLVIDCKYKPGLAEEIGWSDVGQLCSYSRMSGVRDVLGCRAGDSVGIVYLYPDRDGVTAFDGSLWKTCVKVEGLEDAGRIGVRLPVVGE